MRTFFFLLLLQLSYSAGAQDYCNLIKKEVSDDKTTFDFSTPYNPEELPAVRAARSYNNNADYPSDNFYIVFYLTGDLDNIYEKNAEGEQVEKSEKKIVVNFDDSTKYVDDSMVIIHDRTVDMLQSVRYVYLPITDNNLKDFSTKKIMRFSLAGYEQTVPADSSNAMMHYIQCLKAVK